MAIIKPDTSFCLLYSHVPKTREGRENYLTDCLALALADDQPFARLLLEHLLGADHIGSLRLEDAHVHVRTQDGSYDRCCLDLVLDIAKAGSPTAKRIAIECKLGAPLSPRQLAKYMKLPIWGVSVIAKKAITPPDRRVGSRGARWLPLNGASHFQWGDIHVLANTRIDQAGASPFVHALVGLLKQLRLDPPHPEVGRFGRGGSGQEQKQRRAFYENWRQTLPLLAKAGWPDPSPGKQAQVYSGPREGPRNGRRISDLLLNPLADQGRTLRLRLNGYSDRALEDAEKDLKKARLPHNTRVVREIRVVKRKHGPARVLDLDVPMIEVLPEGVSQDARAAALARFVGAVIKKAR